MAERRRDTPAGRLLEGTGERDGRHRKAHGLRHRLGSCRGALAATPQRLEYRTDNANDRFAVPLGDLVAFDVDYLNKRLTLELREGRRYEFTDPEGNADRLFVFHRDVEKARERLDRGDPPANP